MQAFARDGLSVDEVKRILTARVVTPRFGAEIIKPDLTVVEDISDFLTGGSITRDMKGPVHSTCDVEITRELAWGKDRIRLYVILSDGTNQVRFNLGVYLLTTPTRPHGQTPTTFKVKGYDPIYHLTRLVGDSRATPAGMTIAEAFDQIVTDSGVGMPVRIDSDAADLALPQATVWPSMAVGSGQSPTWIRMLTDLTGAIGARPPWVNADGELRTGLYRPDSERPTEYDFTPADLATGVVEPEYTTTADVWGQKNRWWFFMNRSSSALIDGITLYRRDNLDIGLSSQLSIGLNPAQPQGLDVVSYDALVREGNRISDSQIRATETIEADLGTFPALWHEDIAMWEDAQGRRKVKGTWWTMPLGVGPVKTKWEVVQ